MAQGTALKYTNTIGAEICSIISQPALRSMLFFVKLKRQGAPVASSLSGFSVAHDLRVQRKAKPTKKENRDAS